MEQTNNKEDAAAKAPIACSECFSDRGLRLDAEKYGADLGGLCPNCGSPTGKKLSAEAVETTAHKFFVWGSQHRYRYGMAPRIQFNQHQTTSIDVPPWLVDDVRLFERLLGVGFFQYGPRLWMLGEVEPLKALQAPETRGNIIERILHEYPQIFIGQTDLFYRIRLNPREPAEALEYDSPPQELCGRGRVDSQHFPVMYASPDLELCLHECRVTAEDDLYAATLVPTRVLRMLNLAFILEEESVTEFESLDMAVHMLFLAAKHSYDISRDIAKSALKSGFDGLIYPSYFTYLRCGNMPFQTVYGISHRRIPQFRAYEQSRPVQNSALFGHPIRQGLVDLKSIDKVILRGVEYDFHFGPVGAHSSIE